jgi:uncharacterized RDD family membrane protein YckC
LDGICPSCRISVDASAAVAPDDAVQVSPFAPASCPPRAPLPDPLRPIGNVPNLSTVNTILPRHIAAIFDSVGAPVLGIVAAKAVGDKWFALQATVFGIVYVAYFLLGEGLFGRTPGKLLTGLVVVQYDGKRCTFRQALIRTAFRLLEVNPLLLGAIPAAASIVFSRHRQRFGDRVAKTIVVFSRSRRKNSAAIKTRKA